MCLLFTTMTFAAAAVEYKDLSPYLSVSFNVPATGTSNWISFAPSLAAGAKHKIYDNLLQRIELEYSNFNLRRSNTQRTSNLGSDLWSEINMYKFNYYLDYVASPYIKFYGGFGVGFAGVVDTDTFSNRHNIQPAFGISGGVWQEVPKVPGLIGQAGLRRISILGTHNFWTWTAGLRYQF